MVNIVLILLSATEAYDCKASVLKECELCLKRNLARRGQLRVQSSLLLVNEEN